MKDQKKITIFISIIVLLIISLFVGNMFLQKYLAEEEVIVEEDLGPQCPGGIFVEEYELCGVEIGQSVEGRPLYIYQIGTGETKLLFVGGLHTGTERNTFELSQAMLQYYSDVPGRVPESVSMYFLPALNPDGIANDTHTNANDINLNRNWGTDNWKSDVYHPVSGTVEGGGGSAPYSEPEVRALYEYIVSLQPDLAVVWHSKAGTVEDSDVKNADELGAIYAEAAGYTQIDKWTAYEVTGDFVTDMREEEVPAMEVELETREVEFKRNLDGVEAIIAYFVNQ